MKVTCAWCRKDLPDKEPFDDERVSHGICDDCRRQLGIPDPPQISEREKIHDLNDVHHWLLIDPNKKPWA